MAKWSCVELNAAIVCGSIVTLRPLVVRWMSRFKFLQKLQIESDDGVRATHTIGSRRERPVGVQLEGIDIYSMSHSGTSATCVTQMSSRVSEEKVARDLEAQA